MSWGGDPRSVRAVDGQAPIESYLPSAHGYVWNSDRGAFQHPYSRDLQLFVIWPLARPFAERITEMISAEFTVLRRYDVHWSDEHVLRNFERLYATAPGTGAGKQEDSGTGPLTLLIVEDPDPVYQYRQNVSRFLEVTNVRCARVKRAARDLAGGYTVHSSNRLEEFFRDATLMIGPARLGEIIAQPPGDTLPPLEQLHEDLVGARGWRDLSEVVAVLRHTIEYVALRGFDGLPQSLSEDPEIDVLARQRADFQAIVNATGDPSRSASTTSIAGAPIVFDVREVGDGYLDGRWQDTILTRRITPADEIARPRHDDHFFSLLYHAKLQKQEVKPAHAVTLSRLATRLDLPVDLAQGVTEDDAATAVLDGYLSGHGYSVPQPADHDVERNTAFASALRMTAVEPPLQAVVRSYLWSRVRHSRWGARAAESDRLRAVARRLRAARRPKQAGGQS